MSIDKRIWEIGDGLYNGGAYLPGYVVNKGNVQVYYDSNKVSTYVNDITFENGYLNVTKINKDSFSVGPANENTYGFVTQGGDVSITDGIITVNSIQGQNIELSNNNDETNFVIPSTEFVYSAINTYLGSGSTLGTAFNTKDFVMEDGKISLGKVSVTYTDYPDDLTKWENRSITVSIGDNQPQSFEVPYAKVASYLIDKNNTGLYDVIDNKDVNDAKMIETLKNIFSVNSND